MALASGRRDAAGEGASKGVEDRWADASQKEEVVRHLRALAKFRGLVKLVIAQRRQQHFVRRKCDRVWQQLKGVWDRE